MRVFLIHPVRNATAEIRDAVNSVVTELTERGHVVYVPGMHTPQGQSEIGICAANRAAIAAADVVLVIWDAESQGCLFDLGMAYAMDKPVLCVSSHVPARSMQKSFANLLWQMDACARERGISL